MNSIKEAVTSDFRNTPMCKKGNLIKLPLLAAACTEEFMLSLSTIPRQISSASASVSARSQNVGGGGSTMPESWIFLGKKNTLNDIKGFSQFKLEFYLYACVHLYSV